MSLVSLLGEQRAALVNRLHVEGAQTASELAAHLGISDAALRKHLSRLVDDGLVRDVETAASGPGRPSRAWHLTDHAQALFPQRYATVARELIDFISDEHGRNGMRAFLKWRLEKQSASYADVVTSEDPAERVAQLAAALSDAGFEASASETGDGIELVQQHCAIQEIAADHPELCAYEAAAFRRVLGHELTVSRKGTIAGGDQSCVCQVQLRETRGAGTATTS